MELIDREKLLDELGESASYHAESGREYQLLLRDRNIVRKQEEVKAIPIPEGATNGDVIKAIFPNVEIYTDVVNEIVDVEICEDSSELRCSVDWWNTPYESESE